MRICASGKRHSKRPPNSSLLCPTQTYKTLRPQPAQHRAGAQPICTPPPLPHSPAHNPARHSPLLVLATYVRSPSLYHPPLSCCLTLTSGVYYKVTPPDDEMILLLYDATQSLVHPDSIRQSPHMLPSSVRQPPPQLQTTKTSSRTRLLTRTRTKKTWIGVSRKVGKRMLRGSRWRA